MNEILSNEEIDTLLQMFRTEGSAATVEPEMARPSLPLPADTDRVISTIDLLKPNRLAREQLRGLERYFESAAKMLSATISDKLRLDTRCDCVAVEQLRFQTWLDQLPGPVAIYVVKLEPFRLPALLTASTSLLYGAVDRILGGSGKVTKVPKDFTAAEYTVADALMGPCLDRICESFAEVIKLRWSIENRFCNPSAAQILPSQDVVISSYFQASGETLIGDVRLVIPFVSLESIIEKLGQDAMIRVEPGAARATMAKTIRAVPLDLAVRLGEARLPLRQLLELQAGDVVPLDVRLGDPAVIPVQGKPKFAGHVGRIGNRLAFQVADVMAN
ncbi:MAG: FliM/FliN family flagellar motor switch protein [Planctomycetes bacterium]|nr:FliM/FliN family flagellar motor switch protein [Planctomycetota bacterium]